MLEEKICPYPGLRPFNEEESIFFRGREEHIEKIITQLEQRKFMMLTGASGDGKSSMVYAGVVPNAYAGFLKAKFNNWVVADFRPERSPLNNMAASLSEKLGYNDAELVKNKIGIGFSSVVNLYLKSQYHLDYKSEHWMQADETGKKNLLKKAANLLIIVDQFEEFFTNTENYHNGSASPDSHTVVNLLLETAKIALADNLPIYIICTMRSDYIGQCAGFPGLPEYIGYSQFFVPRLKREEIHQAIEEPAILNGDKISNRLTEALIFELGDGFDQLPVLQHALNSLWHIANEGKEEMDLVHLSMIAGLDSTYLPDEDKVKFNNWLSTRPEYYKEYYQNFSLEHSLSANANILYEKAYLFYNEKDDIKITKEDAQLIIKKAFQSLTKIDDSRAVRNRITLKEITNIIDKPNITTEMAGGVINVYREFGNFIKPFITQDSVTHVLKNDSLLDITHESIIRIWDKLKIWVDEENENRSNYTDLNKQVQRWMKSGKKKTYLLGKGPLAYFEDWFNQHKPNKYWLMKYDVRNVSSEQKSNEAEENIKSTEDFLGKSRQVFRRARILQITAVAATIFFIIFMIINENHKKIEQARIEKERLEIEKAKAEKIADQFSFDVVEAKIVASSNYIMKGDDYKADIFISAHNSTLNPNVLIGNVDSTGNISNITDTVPVNGGVGQYVVHAKEEGLQEYEGLVKVKNPNGKLFTYPFKGGYMVGAPSMAVSATKMNVLYLGVANPVDISVSGVAAEDLDVSVTDGATIKKTGQGKYEVSPENRGECDIVVSIVGKNGKKILTGKQHFRVKKVPSPQASFAGVTGDGTIDSLGLANAQGVIPKLDDFVFDLKFPVISWKMSTNVNGLFIEQVATGPAVTDQMKLLLCKVKKGGRVLISDVMIMAPDGKRKISGVTLKVVK